MDRARLAFSDSAHAARSGALVLGDDGRVRMTASPALARALDESVGVPARDVAPLHFDDASRGLALAAALAKGVDARLLELEFVAGAFEVRAYFGGTRVRLTLRPGDCDPDDAWAFLLAWDEAKLAAPRA